MKIAKSIAAAAMVGSLFSSTIAVAGETRAASALPRTHVAQAQQPRAAKQMDEQNDLLGAPLFLLFLGAVAITVGTIIIVNNTSNG